jgi:hypothetical protein
VRTRRGCQRRVEVSYIRAREVRRASRRRSWRLRGRPRPWSASPRVPA